MKDPKKESNKPEEDNRLVKVADEDLDSVTGGCGYADDDILPIDGIDPDRRDPYRDPYTEHPSCPDFDGDSGEPKISDMLQLNPW